MWTWPDVDLTDYERRWVRLYATTVNGKPYPGVLKRVYPIRLTSRPQVTAGFPAQRLVDRLQISRRARVFALVFGGDVYAWRLDIRTSGGEGFTSLEQGTALPPLVSAMCPGTNYNGLANIGEPPVADNRQNSRQFSPLQIEPNWQLDPNTTLDFRGQLIAGLDPGIDQRFLLIGVHVWEFPGMGVEPPVEAPRETSARQGVMRRRGIT